MPLTRSLTLYFVLATLTFGTASALDLHQAQEVLFRDNPDLSILRLEIERAQDQVQESQAAWLPSVDALGNYTYTTEVSHLKLDLPIPPPTGTHLDRPIGDHDKVEVGFDVTYPLFTGFTRGRNVQAKRAGVKSREAQSLGARNQMSLKLASMFYAWQLANAQAEYQGKVLEHARDLAKQLNDYVRAGTAVRSVALGADAKAKAAEVDELSAESLRDSLAYEVLDFLGARDSAVSIGATTLEKDTLAGGEPDWKAEDVGAALRPDIEALDQSVAQTRLGESALAGQKLPQVFGMAGFRYANPGLNLAGDEYMPYGILGLQLKWNIFDGTRNRAQRLQLEVQAREIQEQKRKLILDWKKIMATAKLQYARGTAQYAAAQASREAARASAVDLERQFNAGVATGLDWTEARNNQARAELMMDQAKTLQRMAVLQWEYAAGKELKY